MSGSVSRSQSVRKPGVTATSGGVVAAQPGWEGRGGKGGGGGGGGLVQNPK